MGGMVVLHTGFPHLDTFAELYIYSSGHIADAGLKKFDEYYGEMLRDPATNDKFRVPLYMAAGETDIALKNGQKDLALFDQYGCVISGCSAPAATSGPTGVAIYIGPRRSCSRIALRNSEILSRSTARLAIFGRSITESDRLAADPG
jgi:hypothetical protein